MPAPLLTPPRPKTTTRALSGLRVSGSSDTTGPSAPLAAAQPEVRHPGAEKAWARGVALGRKNRHAEAAAEMQAAIKVAPDVAIYWLNLASLRRKLRDIDDAIRCARKAFELDPKSEVACHLLTELLRLMNRHAEALEAIRALHPDAPRDTSHYMLEGALLMSLQEPQKAADCFLQILAMAPAHIQAYTQLGLALAHMSQFREAAECFRTVVILEPERLGAAIYAAHYTAWACDWQSAGADAERLATALALNEGRSEVDGFSPFCLLSLNDDAAMHRKVATIEAARFARGARTSMAAQRVWTMPDLSPAGYPRVTAKPRRRIGFVSADFRTHATSMLLVQVLEKLDRSRFEIALYSHGIDDKSPLRQRMIDAVDDFVECTEMSAHDEANRIREDGTAILIDLSGYTQNTRLDLFALRPCPVQVLWLAYPSTTGADYIDYLIGDPILTPLEHQDDFSERLAQLPICYEPTDRERIHPPAPTRAACELPEDAFVFACFNQSYKITEAVFSRWCRILQRVPGSVLWLLVPQEVIRASLRQAAADRGIDPERILFAAFVSPEEHLARLQAADLFLDTFPYGAHTTCSDALWMGLPVLTQVGRSFSARVAASLLAAVGLPELAVDNEADYESLAVLLANDKEALHDIRSHLVDNRLDLPLFDSDRFSGELGALFHRMLDRWEAGLPPVQLPAVQIAA